MTDEAGEKMERNGASEKKEHFDYDGLWKDILDKFFYPLLKRALPELYERADKTKRPTFLNKELRDITHPQIRKSPHFADQIAQVPLPGGDTEWVLFHAEAQGPGGGNLPNRMDAYRCFIRLHFNKEPAALAIVTGKRPKDEPKFYSHSHFGTKILYEYVTLVLAELDDKELLSSDNPTDVLLYAAKGSAQSKDEFQKYQYLRAVVGVLSERGWDSEEIHDLLVFAEWLINLKDEKLVAEYEKYHEELRKEGKIVRLTMMEEKIAREHEQIGMEKGMEKGKEEMAREMARNLLANGIAPDVIAQSAGLPIEQIRSLIN
jgi:predicted transposase YdaD